MRQDGSQAKPEPPSSASPSAPRRQRVRWWRVVLLAPLAPLAAGVFGWLDPSEAWRGVWALPVATAVHISMEWERGGILERARPRWIAWMIGYTVLCIVAGFVGARLAR